MAYEELIRGPEFFRDFAEYPKPKEAHSFLGTRTQRSGFGGRETREVVVGLSLTSDIESFIIHPLSGPISLVRAWRATQILNQLKYISGPRTVASAYEVLEEHHKNGSPESPLQRLAADLGRPMVLQARAHMPDLSFVPQDRMDLVAQYEGRRVFKTTLDEVQRSVPPAEKLMEMEKALVDFGVELDQKDLEEARKLLSQPQVPVPSLA